MKLLTLLLWSLFSITLSTRLEGLSEEVRGGGTLEIVEQEAAASFSAEPA